MSLLAENVVEAHRTGAEGRIVDAELGTALFYESCHLSGLAYAGKVAFHIGHKARDASLAEGFRKHLERDGLSCAGCSGNKPVAVDHFAVDANRPLRAVCNV